jgi:hypothetical protein
LQRGGVEVSYDSFFARDRLPHDHRRPHPLRSGLTIPRSTQSGGGSIMLRWSVCLIRLGPVLAAAGGGGVASTVTQGAIFISDSSSSSRMRTARRPSLP